MRTKLFTLTILIIIFLLSLFVDFSPAQEPGEGYLPRFITAGRGIISLPLEASPFTGEAATSVPIELLPAAGDIQEKIRVELQYRSGGGNSWLGKGWELELGYITRINKFGANNSNNPYLLVLNGETQELVNIGGNQYRTKIESNKRIEFDGANWRVWERDGTQYRFENFAGGRWVLTKVTDTHGISIVIEYDKPNDEEIYLKEIRYPEGLGLSLYCKVSFISEDRPDKFISYYYGLVYKVNRRLREIQILADGYIQKRYVLGYTDNGTSQISLLCSLTEYGKDDSSLPSINFSYQQPLRPQNTTYIFEYKGEQLIDSTYYTYEGSFEIPQLGLIPMGINMAIIDLNNDNLSDFMGCKFQSQLPTVSGHAAFKTNWVVHLNTGNGFSRQEDKWLDAENSWFQNGIFYYESISLTRNATLVDMNKDGLPDLVYSKFGGYVTVNGVSQYVYDIFVRYNTATSFSSNEVKLLDHNQAYFIYNVGGVDVLYPIKIGSTAAIVDMNGDNLPDLVYHRYGGTEQWGNVSYSLHNWTVRLNTGSGFSNEEKTWLSYDKAYFKYELPGTGGTQRKLERITINENAILVDMNGDGLLDLVFNDFAEAVRINDTQTGIYFSAPSYNWKVRYNNGNKFSDEIFTFYNCAPVYSYLFAQTGPGNRYRASSVKIGSNGTIADINYDGLPDLVFNKYENGPLVGSIYRPKTSWQVSFNLGDKFSNPVQFLESLDYYINNNSLMYVNVTTYNSYFVDIDKDGISDLVYPYFTEWRDDRKIKFSLRVYKNKQPVSVDLLNHWVSNFGGITDLTYEPSSNFDNKGGDGKNDLSFVIPVVKSVIKHPGVGVSGTTTYNYEGGWYDLLNREFRGFRRVRTTDPLGFVTQTLFHQDDSRLGKIECQENSITKTLNIYKADNSAPYFTSLIQVDEYTDSKCKRISYEYDEYGNVIKTIYFGDIDLTGDEKSILTDYTINSSSWLIDLPSRERIFANTDGSGLPIAETQYFYDNNVNYTDLPIKGDLTKVKRYLNTKNDYIQTSSTYDIYGNEIAMTDANGNTTTIEYDSVYHSFPTKVTNPKGHIEQTSYYLPTDTKGLFGQVKSKTDSNGNETIFEYDGFGRKTKIIGPYDLYSTYGSESYEYSLNGPGANYILTRTTEESGTSYHFIKIDILDGFGRIIQTAKESEDERIYSYITTSYNARGEIAKVSLPYFKDGGLPTSYQAPDSSAKWTQYSYDAIGRITQITKSDMGIIKNSYSGWSTTLTDENGHQKTLVKDAYERLISVREKKLGEEYITTYNYDALDNLTLITDHLGNKYEFFYDSLKRRIKMLDPDLGTWTYDYDNNGNLIKQTDANGEVINFTYDALNRLITKDYISQTGVEINYTYDEANSTNGIGRRTSMQDLSGSSRWYYDKEGRIVKLEKTIDSNTYKLEWIYDAMGRIKSILFPNLKKVDFTYNNAGLTESINGYILNVDYNASNQPTQIIFSNSMTTRFDYYPENYRLKSILTGSLQDLSYEYDKVGNVTKITDSVHSFTKNYFYDDLDRLISGDGNTYEYNAIGNILKVNGITQNYSSSKIHALINDGTNSYSYDSCGNMVSGAGRIISYDPENRPIKIIKDGIITQFVYDGDGKRVKKIVTNGSSAITTIYIEDLFEKEITNF